jgi:transposase InsO family protein
MDIHKNARSCPASRALLVRRVELEGWSVGAAAEAAGISRRRGCEWLRRHRHDKSASVFEDRSSRPHHCRGVTPPRVRAVMVALRRKHLTCRQIASALGVSCATVARVVRGAGLSRLSNLDPPAIPKRYEWSSPGDLLHIDVKKLGRIDGVGHRITGDRRHRSRAGWEFVHVCIDDASRATYVEILSSERKRAAIGFLRRAVAWFAKRGITIRRLLTDNGSAYRSHEFAIVCHELGVRHIRTRPYTPRTNGKAERMIQTLLREWAYRFAYTSSDERSRSLRPYLHFYNHHRAHSALSYNPPISRLVVNNVLRLDN